MNNITCWNRQMGSHMKQAIFEEQTAKALKKWRDAARKKKRLREAGMDVPSGLTSGDATPTHGSSPLHLLRKLKMKSTEAVSSAPPSPRSYQSDNDEIEAKASPLIKLEDLEPRRPLKGAAEEKIDKDDFSFNSPHRT